MKKELLCLQKIFSKRSIRNGEMIMYSYGDDQAILDYLDYNRRLYGVLIYKVGMKVLKKPSFVEVAVVSSN